MVSIVSDLHMENGEIIRATVTRTRLCRDCKGPIYLGQNKYSRWLAVEEFAFNKYRKHGPVCPGKKRDEIPMPYYVAKDI